jgi:hypothetical protein
LWFLNLRKIGQKLILVLSFPAVPIQQQTCENFLGRQNAITYIFVCIYIYTQVQLRNLKTTSEVGKNFRISVNRLNEIDEYFGFCLKLYNFAFSYSFSLSMSFARQ